MLRMIPRRRKLMSSFRIEAAFLVLLLLTVLAIAFRAPLLNRSLVFNARSGNYKTLLYGDANMGGTSTAWRERSRPLAWSCELRAAYDYTYCGFELLMDGTRRQKGIDLRRYDTIKLALSYEGPARSLRLHLKNYDPRYSHPSIGDGDKFNRIDFLPKGKSGEITLPLSDATVPEWWLVQNKVPPELSQPDVNNVIAIDIQTGGGQPLGRHHFQIRSIRLDGVLLSTEQFYLCILATWVTAIGLFFIHRISCLKRDVEARRLLQAALQCQAEEAERAAKIDPLTRLLNRSGIAEKHRELIDRNAGPLTAMLIDIDHFKSINDTLGHSCGDEVLASFAGILKRNARDGDVVGRWGGEEFLILCAGLDEEQALAYANGLCRRIRYFHFGECETVTASFGLRTSGQASLSDVVSDADFALYAAKERGRNRVELFSNELRRAA
ncbi:GGDEF domain-containing protein [uncultured Sphingomonas sp.]|uniref:GGDEF domain-containing protein n=1 Tax=uncultured Sphingomonas sp. TaxID=158754 RepID=UPI0035CB3A19